MSEPQKLEKVYAQRPKSATILVEEHERRMKNLRETMEQRVAEAEAAADRKMQSFATMQNKYNDLSNIFKGLMKWGPDSLRNALYLVDFLYLHAGNIFNMHKMAHKGRQPPYLMIGMFCLVGIILVALLFTPDGAAVARSATAILFVFVILLLIGLVGMMTSLRKSRSDRPQ